MTRIVVQTFLTFDGVMQAPGGPEEDPTDGFEHGGWQAQYGSEESGEVVAQWHSGITGLLLGRRTYEIFAGHWGRIDPGEVDGLDSTVAADFHRVPKYVASRTLTELSWQNSHLLGEDVPAAVARIRDEGDGEVQVWGSGPLVRTLMEHGLVDEFRLMVYPIVLGSGRRLFAEGTPTTGFEVAEMRPLPNGVFTTIVRPGADVRYVDMGASDA
jgi:dihydrofolate reductase